MHRARHLHGVVVKIILKREKIFFIFSGLQGNNNKNDLSN